MPSLCECTSLAYLSLCSCQFLGRWYMIAVHGNSTTQINSGVSQLTRYTEDVISLLFTGSMYAGST